MNNQPSHSQKKNQQKNMFTQASNRVWIAVIAAFQSQLCILPRFFLGSLKHFTPPPPSFPEGYVKLLWKDTKDRKESLYAVVCTPMVWRCTRLWTDLHRRSVGKQKVRWESMKGVDKLISKPSEPLQRWQFLTRGVGAISLYTNSDKGFFENWFCWFLSFSHKHICSIHVLRPLNP